MTEGGVEKRRRFERIWRKAATKSREARQAHGEERDVPMIDDYRVDIGRVG
jgi:hypothetical protein